MTISSFRFNAGDTIIFRKGSSFQVEGVMRGTDDLPFDYSDAELEIYETLKINKDEIAVEATDPATGKFLVTITDQEADKLMQGRQSWFKLILQYPTSIVGWKIVLPPIWIQVE